MTKFADSKTSTRVKILLNMACHQPTYHCLPLKKSSRGSDWITMNAFKSVNEYFKTLERNLIKDEKLKTQEPVQYFFFFPLFSLVG